MEESNPAAQEFAVIQKIHNELVELSDDARIRVLSYLIDLLDIPLTSATKPKTDQGPMGAGKRQEVHGELDEFVEFAELADAVEPRTNADRALVAGYWLQQHEGNESFDSQSANKLLKDLGHGVANITAALSALKEQKPALVLQLKKSGSSQQARKKYKVTVAGVRAIEQMIGAGDQE